MEFYKKIIQKLYRKFVRLKNKNKIKEKDITILCNNCLGGMIAHDFSLKFNSPLINVNIIPSNFIKLCNNIEYYMNCELVEVCDKEKYVPIFSQLLPIKECGGGKKI